MADARAPELRGRAAVVAIAVVVVALIGGGAWGWSYAGPLGGLLGVLLGTAVGALGFTIMRLRVSGAGLDERPAPDVRELPPEQAMQVLTALMNAGASEGRGGPSLAGGVVTEVARARARAEAGDVEGALALLRGLAEQYPRAPAVPAEMARVLASREEWAQERLRAASRAIGLAVHGGMYRVAVQVFEELDEEARGRVELERGVWGQLGRIFASRGEEALATLCHHQEQNRT